MPSDIQVRDVSLSYDDFRYRTPIKFGGVALDRVTILNVWMETEGGGKVSRGFGSMPLGNVWAWPTRALAYDETLTAMQRFAGATASLYAGCKAVGHPIDITHTLEPELLRMSYPEPVAEPMPPLAKLVVASAFDAALHDAYGKLHGLNCYKTYGPEFVKHDLGHYLGEEFADHRLHNYIATEPKPRMPLYHLVGAPDPLTPADVKTPVGDGLPEHLGDWIRRDGLTHLK